MKEHEQVTTVEGALRRKLEDQAEDEVGQLFAEFDGKLQSLIKNSKHTLRLDHLKIVGDRENELGAGDTLMRRIMTAVVNKVVDIRFPASLQEIVDGKPFTLSVDTAAREPTARRALLHYKINDQGMLDGMRVVADENIAQGEEIRLAPSLYVKGGTHE